MIKYKIDVIQELRDAGYNTTRIRREKIISEASLQMIREGRVVAMQTLDHLCKALDMQPGNIIKYVPDED